MDLSASDDSDMSCPLCLEEMDSTDRKFQPCHCGYQICLWCWHHIMEMAKKDSLEGRCPACRSPYDKEKIVSAHHADRDELPESGAEKKQKFGKGRSKATAGGGGGGGSSGSGVGGGASLSGSDARKHLANVRVVQRNLVYVVGMPYSLADEETLERKEYFGQYGRVLKIAVSRSNSSVSGSSSSSSNIHGATANVYVTFVREEDAVRCIQAIDGCMFEGRVLRACFGTTKYCNAWLKNLICPNPDCLYLHEVGMQEDSYTKEEMLHRYNTGLLVPGGTGPSILGASTASSLASKHGYETGAGINRRAASGLPPPVDGYSVDKPSLMGWGFQSGGGGAGAPSRIAPGLSSAALGKSSMAGGAAALGQGGGGAGGGILPPAASWGAKGASGGKLILSAPKPYGAAGVAAQGQGSSGLMLANGHLGSAGPGSFTSANAWPPPATSAAAYSSSPPTHSGAFGPGLAGSALGKAAPGQGSVAGGTNPQFRPSAAVLSGRVIQASAHSPPVFPGASSAASAAPVPPSSSSTASAGSASGRGRSPQRERAVQGKSPPSPSAMQSPPPPPPVAAAVRHDHAGGPRTQVGSGPTSTAGYGAGTGAGSRHGEGEVSSFAAAVGASGEGAGSSQQIQLRLQQRQQQQLQEAWPGGRRGPGGIEEANSSVSSSNSSSGGSQLHRLSDVVSGVAAAVPRESVGGFMPSLAPAAPSMTPSPGSGVASGRGATQTARAKSRLVVLGHTGGSSGKGLLASALASTGQERGAADAGKGEKADATKEKSAGDAASEKDTKTGSQEQVQGRRQTGGVADMADVRSVGGIGVHNVAVVSGKSDQSVTSGSSGLLPGQGSASSIALMTPPGFGLGHQAEAPSLGASAPKNPEGGERTGKGTTRPRDGSKASALESGGERHLLSAASDSLEASTASSLAGGVTPSQGVTAQDVQVELEGFRDPSLSSWRKERQDVFSSSSSLSAASAAASFPSSSGTPQGSDVKGADSEIFSAGPGVGQAEFSSNLHPGSSSSLLARMAEVARQLQNQSEKSQGKSQLWALSSKEEELRLIEGILEMPLPLPQAPSALWQNGLSRSGEGLGRAEDVGGSGQDRSRDGEPRDETGVDFTWDPSWLATAAISSSLKLRALKPGDNSDNPEAGTAAAAAAALVAQASASPKDPLAGWLLHSLSFSFGYSSSGRSGERSRNGSSNPASVRRASSVLTPASDATGAGFLSLSPASFSNFMGGPGTGSGAGAPPGPKQSRFSFARPQTGSAGQTTNDEKSLTGKPQQGEGMSAPPAAGRETDVVAPSVPVVKPVPDAPPGFGVKRSVSISDGLSATPAAPPGFKAPARVPLAAGAAATPTPGKEGAAAESLRERGGLLSGGRSTSVTALEGEAAETAAVAAAAALGDGAAPLALLWQTSGPVPASAPPAFHAQGTDSSPVPPAVSSMLEPASTPALSVTAPSIAFPPAVFSSVHSVPAHTATQSQEPARMQWGLTNSGDLSWGTAALGSLLSAEARQPQLASSEPQLAATVPPGFQQLLGARPREVVAASSSLGLETGPVQASPSSLGSLQVAAQPQAATEPLFGAGTAFRPTANASMAGEAPSSPWVMQAASAMPVECLPVNGVDGRASGSSDSFSCTPMQMEAQPTGKFAGQGDTLDTSAIAGAGGLHPQAKPAGSSNQGGLEPWQLLEMEMGLGDDPVASAPFTGLVGLGASMLPGLLGRSGSNRNLPDGKVGGSIILKAASSRRIGGRYGFGLEPEEGK